MKHLLFLSICALGLCEAAYAQAPLETVYVSGEWSLQHDAVGVPQARFDSPQGLSLRFDWSPQESLEAPRQALYSLIIPQEYSSCSVKRAVIHFSDTVSLPVVGDGVCRPSGGVPGAGVFLSTPKAAGGLVAVSYLRSAAREVEKSSYPVSVSYGGRDLFLRDLGEASSFSGYVRETSPQGNPRLYSEMGIR